MRYKYNRTPHLPCSLSKTEDDKTLSDYSSFIGKDVVVTLKMDGENTTCYSDGTCHARSIDSRHHVSRDWLKKWWASKYYLLPAGYRIAGENLYAKHSIHYRDLESYFYLFAAADADNTYLSWEETKHIASILKCPTPDEIYLGPFDIRIIDLLCSKVPKEHEGFVMRNVESFHYKDFSENCGKMVRKNHIQSETHWMSQEVIPNILKNT